MYATSGGAPAGSAKVLQVENPYFDASSQQPRNTKQLRAQKPVNMRTPARGATMPMKMPSHQGGGSLENLLRPSGLQAMNAAQQYQKLVSMRAQSAQMQREDNAMREFQRMAGAGAGIGELGEMTDRQRRDLEMSDVLLQSRPFIPDLQGGYMTSGAERANARTQARRRQAGPGGPGGRAAPPTPGSAPPTPGGAPGTPQVPPRAPPGRRLFGFPQP